MQAIFPFYILESVKKSLFLLLFASLIFPTVVFARIGVGVASGKIQVQDKLKPGIIYNLPPLTVLNTGDIPSDYEVAVTYFETQPQRKPPNDWFIFSPRTFHLDPGNAQVVTIKINLPITTTPGDYFGFLEAHPIQKDKAGQTTIGIAAAAKLYFTIVPANIFEAIYYKIISFWEVFAPWPQYFVTLLIIIGVILFVKKYFNIQIGLRKPKTTHTEQGEKPSHLKIAEENRKKIKDE